MAGRPGIIQNAQRLAGVRRMFEEFGVPLHVIAASYGLKDETLDWHAERGGWKCAPSESDMLQIRSRLLRVMRDSVAPLLDDPKADPTETAKLAQSLTRLMEAALRLFGTMDTEQVERRTTAGDARARLFRKLDAFVAEDAEGVA